MSPVCLCVHASVHLSTHPCVFACPHARVCACVRVRMCVCTCTLLHDDGHVCVLTERVPISPSCSINLRVGIDQPATQSPTFPRRCPSPPDGLGYFFFICRRLPARIRICLTRLVFGPPSACSFHKQKNQVQKLFMPKNPCLFFLHKKS